MTPEPSPQTPRIVMIVPVGTLEGAKSRLGATLDAEERHDLAQRLARRTIEAAVATRGIDETIVVTPDDEVRQLALYAGARPIRQRGRGLNAGLEEARAEAVAGGATAIVIVPIDLPAVSAPALETVVNALVAPGGTRVVLIPDRHGRGTNVLGITPPDAIELAFGGESRAAHEAATRRAGAEFVMINGPLRIDLDTPEDLLLAERFAPDVVGAR